MNGAEVPAGGINKLRLALTKVDAEWILQHNSETSPLWEPLLASPPPAVRLSVLFDASAGLGLSPGQEGFPPVDRRAPCGFAGGIGPSNLASVMESLMNRESPSGVVDESIWVDMESSLRNVSLASNGEVVSDTFALDKAEECLGIALEQGYITSCSQL